MFLRISPADGVPIYLQIVTQVKHLAATGRLQAGDELPAIRALAEQLRVNPNTVVRAYLELERLGLVSKRHGSGTYVSDTGLRLTRRERIRILSERVDALLTEARHLNVDLEELTDLIHQRHGAFQPEDKP